MHNSGPGQHVARGCLFFEHQARSEFVECDRLLKFCRFPECGGFLQCGDFGAREQRARNHLLKCSWFLKCGEFGIGGGPDNQHERDR